MVAHLRPPHRAPLAEVLALPGAEARTAARARALMALSASHFFSTGQHAQAETELDEPLSIFRELADRRGVALVLHAQGVVAAERGSLDEARARHEESLAIRREIGESGAIAYSLSRLASVSVDRGDFVRAATLNEEALALMKAPAGRSEILRSLGELAHEQGAFSTARAWYEKALACDRARGRNAARGSLTHLAWLCMDEGDPVSAIAFGEDALALLHSHGDQAGETRSGRVGVLGVLAEAALQAGDPTRAHRHVLEAMALCQQLVAAGLSGSLRSKTIPAHVCALHALACLTAARDPARALRLAAAAGLQRRSIFNRMPSAVARRQRYLAPARAALSLEEAAAAWAEGEAMLPEQTIAYALEEPAFDELHETTTTT